MSKHSSIITDIENIDAKKISFAKVTYDEKYSYNQKNTFPVYEYSTNKTNKLVFLTKPIKFTQYGLPQLNSTFIPSDKDRFYFKIPCDSTQPNSIALFKKLKEIDDYVISQKKIILGDAANSYTYMPIIKGTPSFDDDNDDDNDDDDVYVKKNKKFAYCKIAFNFKLNDNHEKILDVYVFTNNNNNVISLDENVKTITDLEKYLLWNSTACFAIKVHKIWASSNGQFGVKLVCSQILSSYNNNIDKNLFKENDDSSQSNKQTNIIQTHNIQINSTHHNKKNLFDYDDVIDNQTDLDLDLHSNMCDADLMENENENENKNLYKNISIIETINQRKKLYDKIIDTDDLIIDI